MRHALALIVTLLATLARADGPRERTFGETIGLNVKFAQGQPSADLALLTELNVRWVRDTVLWAEMEPKPGEYAALSPAFAERLAFYKTNNIGLVFGCWYDNPVAYPMAPTDANAYGRYAAEIARRLKASGVGFVIELYNEPHNSLKSIGGNWNGEPPSAWLDHYLMMVRAAVREVKAVDPSIALLAGDDMWVIQNWMLEGGLPKEIDALTVHPYTKRVPEIAAVDQDTTWARPFALVDADASFASAVRRLRSRATEKLGRTPAIWITEWGWPVGAMPDARDEASVAAFVPRAYLAAAAAGVEATLWFSIQDNVDGPMGLIDNAGKRRGAFNAFKTMSATLGGCTDVEHVLGRDRATVGVQAYRLRDGVGKRKLVAWNISGTSSARLVDGGPDARVYDVVGQAVNVERNVDGSIPLTLGPSPFYISGVGDGAYVEPAVENSVPATYLFK